MINELIPELKSQSKLQKIDNPADGNIKEKVNNILGTNPNDKARAYVAFQFDKQGYVSKFVYVAFKQ